MALLFDGQTGDFYKFYSIFYISKLIKFVAKYPKTCR